MIPKILAAHRRAAKAVVRATPSPRRFPPPWTVEEHAECFIVRDATGQALGYFYFDDELGR